MDQEQIYLAIEKAGFEVRTIKMPTAATHGERSDYLIKFARPRFEIDQLDRAHAEFNQLHRGTMPDVRVGIGEQGADFSRVRWLAWLAFFRSLYAAQTTRRVVSPKLHVVRVRARPRTRPEHRDWQRFQRAEWQLRRNLRRG